MADVLERYAPAPALPPVTRTEIDERALRRTLRDQIAKLERELASLFCTSFPRKAMEFGVASRGGGPRLLAVTELEQLRDDLIERLHAARSELSERARVEQHNRRRIEEMLLAPEEHRWQIVSNEDIGEAGCRHWHSRPRFGLLGMLMGWWRIRISSGCPLVRGRGYGRRPEPTPLRVS